MEEVYDFILLPYRFFYTIIIVTEDIGTCLCLSSVIFIVGSANIWRIDCSLYLSNDLHENLVNGNNDLQFDYFNVEVP